MPARTFVQDNNLFFFLITNLSLNWQQFHLIQPNIISSSSSALLFHFLLIFSIRIFFFYLVSLRLTGLLAFLVLLLPFNHIIYLAVECRICFHFPFPFPPPQFYYFHLRSSSFLLPIIQTLSTLFSYLDVLCVFFLVHDF